MNAPRVLILGASGRLGGMLRRHWIEAHAHPVWQFRSPPSRTVSRGSVHVCDPLVNLPDCGPVDAVVSLAGIVPGKTASLSLNTELGLAAIDCAGMLGARHVFLSSSAAVYGAAASPLHEDGTADPVSAYGQAKLAMEEAARLRAARYGIAVTALRIGNVAGADALLGQNRNRYRLDQLVDGRGPVRSYIGPREFARLLQALSCLACRGATLPTRLNLALPGCVAMADLCRAAATPFDWHPAPAHALQSVVLDVARLAALVPLPWADPAEIVADWLADRRLA
ncbi:NAD(P)-dependent oxidoreductase [Roseinatronobacter sp.]|uniref:NAD-dependent epimerase/dehydratase family protein n=1 Tax=Roseinatronobacter sp. TaxID=1945755 RepID=UPI00260124C9|nr:NAD-dependent epimerase/dehydratase family protein [Rhodobaca sp.]